MRREPPITFRGALQVLGVYERPLVDRLDRLLGGVILTAGALATVPALAPLAPIWGWVDQKSEATGLLRACLDKAQARLSGLRGHERVELIAAAHTMVVLAAFFDTLRDVLGKAEFNALAITEAEKEMLAAGRWRQSDEALLTQLWAFEVPMPSGARGFMENFDAVEDWYFTFSNQVTKFLDGLDAGGWRAHVGSGRKLPAEFAARACDRYSSYYLQLAATVPDFWIWAQLGEHAATRSAAREVAEQARTVLRAALEGPGAALLRVEALLTGIGSGPPRSGHHRDALSRANRDVLSLPVVQQFGTEDHPDAITFPTVEDGYINPAYRMGVADRTTRPADESWWDSQPIRHDLDLAVARQFTTYDATRRPMLLLGHPGGGKSMLTKILAARLPDDAYTVVRVPLRQVVANAPIHDQIRQALELTTHGRAAGWFEVAEDGAETIRVVLLDGLDELLQATTHDRSGYLREVMEFQRVEAAQDRPVMVVVTSRTVVAERVDIPPGTPIAKLEEFDDAQVGRWLEAWNRANAAAVAAGRLRRLTPEAALAHPELARQPLLLLMLAIYRADPDQPADLAELSLTDLYQRLLSTFAVREVRKKAGEHLRGAALEAAVTDQLHRLSVAAIGMFNRGRQDITESELGADLHGLERDGGTAPDVESLGRRVLGEFFFVHAAEATERPGGRDVRRCYEFLHATFGEYLIASLVVGELSEIADAAFGGSRGPREPAGDLLYTLLAHQTLASRRPILDFAEQILQQMTDVERARIVQTLDVLARRYDRRVDARRYPRYRPLPESNLRSLAAYSANLILLRTLLDDEVPITGLCQEQEVPLARWRATVNLWRAGLDTDGWQAMLDALAFADGTVRWKRRESPWPAEFSDIQYVRLVGDRDAELQLRIGSAFHHRLLYYVDGDGWAETMVSWLLPAIVLPIAEQPGFILRDPPPGTAESDIDGIRALISDALIRQAREWSPDFVRLLLGWVRRNDLALDPMALAAAVHARPSLAGELPWLADPGLYEYPESRWLRWAAGQRVEDDRLIVLLDDIGPNLEARNNLRDLVDHLVQRTTETVAHTPLPYRNGHSIVSMRDADPTFIGSTTGSLPEGQTWSPEMPLPELLE